MEAVNLENLYRELCATADPGAMLDRMGDATLAALAAHLEAAGIPSGVPAIVTGLVELEIVRRWVAEHRGNHSPVGEG
jgi:hypothetical protein